MIFVQKTCQYCRNAIPKTNSIFLVDRQTVYAEPIYNTMTNQEEIPTPNDMHPMIQLVPTQLRKTKILLTQLESLR